MSNTFKENWLKTDEVCPSCGKVTKRFRGITKQNLKRLITPQWNINELLITFMIIMVLVLAFAYKNETKQCSEWISSMYEGDVDSCKFNCNYNCDMINNRVEAQNLTQRNEYNFTYRTRNFTE